MRLYIAIATLFLAATTALPAFASAPNGHYFYSHSAPAAARHLPAANGWGHCVRGLEEGGRSAFPSWDVC